MSDLYFDWLCGKVQISANYSALAKALHDIPFRYSVAHDKNRYADGVNLRYRFGGEYGFDDADIKKCIDILPCSVFEMMVALCLRIEEHFMYGSYDSDHTGVWFNDMLKSLGLSDFTNNAFPSADIFDDIIDRFLDRRYSPNGMGGLFTVKNRKGFGDFRTVEIWYQMCLYLDDISDI